LFFYCPWHILGLVARIVVSSAILTRPKKVVYQFNMPPLRREIARDVIIHMLPAMNCSYFGHRTNYVFPVILKKR
jgi:hypothetical protein